MLTGIHFLQSYACTYECDHCFLYCSPRSEGTFTGEQIATVLEDARGIESMEWVYFEGGEPFLFYPVMLEGVRLSKKYGYKVGIVSNSYWATSVADARLWLSPLKEMGIDDLSLSNDSFHSEDPAHSYAQNALTAAAELGLPHSAICIEEPTIKAPTEAKGKPVVEGGTLFKGRAADKLIQGLPTKSASGFTECKHEELANPERVHIDSFGNVQVCQGISIGNLWDTPLSKLMTSYRADSHPICGPLLQGGPIELANTHKITIDHECVDECHYCFEVRRRLIDRFPQYLTPRQVYGLESA